MTVASWERGHRARRPAGAGLRVVAAMLVALTTAGATASCSDSEDLSFGANDRIDPSRTSTTADIDGNKSLIGGAETVEQIQGIIDKLLASTDGCAILTQQVVKGYKIDPSAFASPEVFARLSEGLVQVFDHLVSITDVSLREPLLIEKEALSQALEVVNAYIDNPSNPQATVEIQAIAAAPEFVAASAQISQWAADNC